MWLSGSWDRACPPCQGGAGSWLPAIFPASLTQQGKGAEKVSPPFRQRGRASPGSTLTWSPSPSRLGQQRPAVEKGTENCGTSVGQWPRRVGMGAISLPFGYLLRVRLSQCGPGTAFMGIIGKPHGQAQADHLIRGQDPSLPADPGQSCGVPVGRRGDALTGAEAHLSRSPFPWGPPCSSSRRLFAAESHELHLS